MIAFGSSWEVLVAIVSGSHLTYSGKADYYKCPEAHVQKRPSLKFFEISSGTGMVDVDPIYDCCQDSLNHDKVMIIDAGMWFSLFLSFLVFSLLLTCS
jgi:hypothetical protein